MKAIPKITCFKCGYKWQKNCKQMFPITDENNITQFLCGECMSAVAEAETTEEKQNIITSALEENDNDL